MKRILAVLLCAAMMVILLSSCTAAGKTTEESPQMQALQTIIESQSDGNSGITKIALVLTEESSSNLQMQAVSTSMEEAESLYGVETIVVEQLDASLLSQTYQKFVDEGYALVITAGAKSVEPALEIAGKTTKTKFMILDQSVSDNRVRSVVFRDEECAYLMGVVAATVSASGTVGMISALQNEASKPSRWAFEEGVHSIRPEISVLYDYTASYNDLEKSNSLALAMLASGADFLYLDCEAANEGAAEAARSQQAYFSQFRYTENEQNDADDAIVEVDDYFIGDIFKKSSLAIFDAIEEIMTNTYQTGLISYGLAEGAYEIPFITTSSEEEAAPSSLNSYVVEAAQKAMDQIMSGEIDLKVPEDYK